MKTIEEIGKSPLLLVGAAGAALVAVVYISAKNRPAVETVGGQIPFSFDALANWLAAREGGPGGGSGAGTPPVYVGPPTNQTDPPYYSGGEVDPPGQTDPPYYGGPPMPVWNDPPTKPKPKPFETPGQLAPGSTDDTTGEKYDIGRMPPGVGGQARIIGLSPAALYAQTYNRIYAEQSADREEGKVHGGGH